jgi:hypothetical protein
MKQQQAIGKNVTFLTVQDVKVENTLKSIAQHTVAHNKL